VIFPPSAAIVLLPGKSELLSFFDWQKSSVSNLFWQPYDGSSPMERLAAREYSQYPGSWSSDATKIALVEWHADAGFDIAVLEVRSGRVTPFLNSQFSVEAWKEGLASFI
jgi:hypothetical protein